MVGFRGCRDPRFRPRGGRCFQAGVAIGSSSGEGGRGNGTVPSMPRIRDGGGAERPAAACRCAEPERPDCEPPDSAQAEAKRPQPELRQPDQERMAR
jgi:hypothetical protein